MRLYTQANVPTEVSLTASQQYPDISNDTEVDVVFTAPDGESCRAPAFWAGGDTFRARFAPPVPGVYEYRSVCTDPGDSGLHDQVGEVECRPYEGTNCLYHHGRLRVAQSGRTLEHADGTPFLWMGDTWWMGLTTRLDWPHGFRTLAADRAAKGFNLVQIVAGPLPDFDAATQAWHPQQANEAGCSWEPGWARLNPAFYDLADLRIASLVEWGLVPCIVGMWGYYLPFMGVAKARQHWRNLIARYGAYPVVWCSAGEVTMPTYSAFGDSARVEALERAQMEGWTEVTRAIRELDPYHNPVTAHPSYPNSRAMLLDPSLVDIDMLQTGHGSYAGIEMSIQRMLDAVALPPRIPVVNGEPAYEAIMGGSLQDVQRILFWGSMTNGAAGHTYGAQGIWAMSARDEPFVGYTGSWGDGFWQDAMHYPGSAQVGLGARLLRRYPWWLFEPRREASAPEASMSHFATGIRGAVAIFYLPANCFGDPLRGIQGPGLAFSGLNYPISIEPGAAYRAFWFNPRTGVETEVGVATPGDNGIWNAPPKPTMADWVLVMEDAAALARLRASGR
jgi:hypothetical protein